MSNTMKYLTALALVVGIFGSLANIALAFFPPPPPPATLTVPIIILQNYR